MINCNSLAVTARNISACQSMGVWREVMVCKGE